MQEILELGVTLAQVSTDVDEVASRAASRYVGLLEWLARERDLFRASIGWCLWEVPTVTGT